MVTGAPRLPASPRRVRSYVGLGSNVGDAAGNLAAAVHALAAQPGVRVVAVSRLYLTAPVGHVEQPDFHNAVVALDVASGPDPGTSALALLAVLKDLEHRLGRRRRARWGPREIDLDLLAFGRHHLRVERPPALAGGDSSPGDARWLVVPHPAVRERLFVLAPLADLAPRLRPPGWGETVSTARARAATVEGPAAARPIGRWESRAGGWVAP